MSHPWADRVARLASSVADAAHLAAGRADFTRGQVGALRIAAGAVDADVAGDEPRPFAVRIAAAPPTAEEWTAVEDAILARPALELRIAGGELPVELAGAMAAAGVPLVPGPEELAVTCTCSGADDACRHVAATLTALAARVAEEPAALLLWRGRTHAALAESLRGRGGFAQALAAAASAPDEHERALPLDELFWTGWHAADPPVAPRAAASDLVLDELGPPPELAGGEESGARLRELYRAFPAG